MKFFIVKVLVAVAFLASLGMKSRVEDEVELVCMRKQHSTKTCHYNFIINGMPYRYVDNGCKETKEALVKKAKEGKLALAREWKVDCHQQKDGPN
ncbi:MAG: hypothetical protein HRU69_08775 [Flammeovirgaceae bacterium]|nr:MAG: hypothetical protein HRU69_08775 [Flammeovirgaceae bacterium]